MNKAVLSLFIAISSLYGCATRTIPYDADRVDQELSGNRGLIYGDPGALPTVERKKTRKMYNVEIELPSENDRSLKGNRGYVYKLEVGKADTAPTEEASSKEAIGTAYMDTDEGQAVAPNIVNEPTIYVVQKNDTLQKISKKMYGTTKLWKKIYDANASSLKDPNRIKPGQKLTIPER